MFSDSAIKKVISIVLTATCHFIFSALPVNAAYDPTPPRVTLCSVSTTTISENGGELRVILHIVGPTPVDFAVVNVMNSTGNSIAFGRLSLSSGTNNDGDWSGSFSVRPNLKPGLYSVVAQNVMDTSQNSITFYYCPNLKIDYGNFNSSIPTPTPTPTPVSTPSSKPILVVPVDVQQKIENISTRIEVQKSRLTKPLQIRDVNNLKSSLNEYIKFFNGEPNRFGSYNPEQKMNYVNILESNFEKPLTVLEKMKIEIKCTKGKLTKKITAVNPKCPAGYKKA